MIAPSIERSSSSSGHRGPPVGLGAGAGVEVGGGGLTLSLAGGCAAHRPEPVPVDQVSLTSDGTYTLRLDPNDPATDRINIQPAKIVAPDGSVFLRGDDNLRQTLEKALNWPIPEGHRLAAFGGTYWKQAEKK